MLRLENISVDYGDTHALDNASLSMTPKEIVCILGPSGSGKSTLLRVLAGLTRPAPGAIVELDGQDLTNVPTYRRNVGLMFQDQVLFPHLSVLDNVAFGLRAHGVDRRSSERRAVELLALVGLNGAGSRHVQTLSGGEAQRVALARALAPSPQLLMLDEPFGQLDRLLRDRLLVELRELFTTLGTTVLAVTHDQREAVLLADRLAIMQAGRIAQTGTIGELRKNPASDFVAQFVA